MSYFNPTPAATDEPPTEDDPWDEFDRAPSATRMRDQSHTGRTRDRGRP